MTSRIIDDPTAAGWSETAPGFWEFVGGGSAGTGIEEAPKDSKQYARQDAAWSEVVIPEAPEIAEFVETDPTVPSHVKAISTDDIANWSAAYSWEDHEQAGYATMMWVQNNYQSKGNYLTDFTETDPTVPSHVKSITTTNISHWDQAWDEATEANGWGNHANAGYAAGDHIHDGRYYLKAQTKKNEVMTEAQYNALGSKDANTIYFLT